MTMKILTSAMCVPFVLVARLVMCALDTVMYESYYKRRREKYMTELQNHVTREEEKGGSTTGSMVKGNVHFTISEVIVLNRTLKRLLTEKIKVVL